MFFKRNKEPRRSAITQAKILEETGWFWAEALGMRGSAILLVLPTSLIFALNALLVYLLYRRYPRINAEVGPHELAGALLGLILVMRTNYSYDRWWEARKLWGGMVNQSRNLVTAALAYGPEDPTWRASVVRFTAAFAHACRLHLRGEPQEAEVFRELLSPAEVALLTQARHGPAHLCYRLALLLKAAAAAGMDRFAFLQIDRERATLMDHLGGCERILKTPIPKSYSMKIRGFILMYMGTLPFSMVQKLEWYTPILVLLVSYPVLALDQAGIELQNPFNPAKLSHLPLDDISNNIQQDLLALEATAPPAAQ